MAAYIAKQPPATSFACARPGTSMCMSMSGQGTESLDPPSTIRRDRHQSTFNAHLWNFRHIVSSCQSWRSCPFLQGKAIMLISNYYLAFHPCISGHLALIAFFYNWSNKWTEVPLHLFHRPLKTNYKLVSQLLNCKIRSQRSVVISQSFWSGDTYCNDL